MNINQLCADIMRLAVEITNKTEIDVFVEYAGHVLQLSVFIYPEGWDKKEETHNTLHKMYLDEEFNSLNNQIKYLSKVRNELYRMVWDDERLLME